MSILTEISTVDHVESVEKETYFIDRKTPPTPTEVDYCESRFAHLPVRMVSNMAKVKTSLESDGVKYRFAYALRLFSDRIEISLFRGSTAIDARLAELEVGRVKNGHYNDYPWSHHEKPETGSYEYIRIGVRKGYYKELDQNYRNYPVRSCRVPECEKFGRYHECDDEDYEAPLFHRYSAFEGKGYSILGNKVGNEPWTYELLAEELETAQIPGLISDLQWLYQELKAKEAAAETHPVIQAVQS